MVKKYYGILEINENATQEEIKNAYRTLSLKYHPDRQHGKSLEEKRQANEKMKEINNAYGVLGDEELRKKYDLGQTNFTSDFDSYDYEAEINEEFKRKAEELRKKLEEIELLLQINDLEKKALDRQSTITKIGAALCFTWPRVYAEDLDPILWQPYQRWGEKVVKMKINIPRGKQESEELKKFKEEMIKAIKEAEITLRIRKENEKKSRENRERQDREDGTNSELNQARTDAFGYIEKEMNERGLKAQDLGEYANYRERINSLGEVWKIRNLREKIILDVISKLGRKHNPNYNNNQNDTNNTSHANNENSGANNNSDNNSNSNNQTNIKALKEQAISAIKSALTSPEPKLTNSDLDSEYRGWESKLNGLSEESEINSWEDKILAHIQAKKIAKQTSQKLNEDFVKTQDPNATVQDKKEALDELDKNEGEQAYEEKKEQIKETKKEVAQDNPNEYRNKIISSLEQKLAENELSENDLDEQTKQEIKDLKTNTNLEPEKLVETEIKLIKKIGQTGAKKKVDNLAFKVEEVSKNKDKGQVEKLKKKLLEIINSSNVYYSAHKSRAEQLLKELESITNFNNNSQSSNPFPLSAKIGIGVVIVLIFCSFMFLIWRRKRTRK